MCYLNLSIVSALFPRFNIILYFVNPQSFSRCIFSLNILTFPFLLLLRIFHPLKNISSLSLQSRNPPPLKKQALALYHHLVRHRDSHGRQTAELFMRKPSAKMYPEYYLVIRSPIDFREISQKIKTEQVSAISLSSLLPLCRYTTKCFYMCELPWKKCESIIFQGYLKVLHCKFLGATLKSTVRCMYVRSCVLGQKKN